MRVPDDQLVIVYRDYIGGRLAILDAYGVSFAGGEAYFSVDDKDYKIDIKDIDFIGPIGAL